MPRDAVAITALPKNAATAFAAGTAMSPTNGAVIAAGGDTGRLLIYLKNTFAGSKAVTIGAGVYPPAALQGQGALVVTMATQNLEMLVVIESGRFAQANGDIYVDFAASMTGNIAAYRLGKTA
jgi:hypothetical protein